ncbi:hypothetical protein SAMN04487996_111145 [Dyadobacter soli]|uniref:Uncharacterized protein n=1 Tax=Dyadobacter soli TaxID=659014 RepID=A0A1G7M2G4_9BACT|nr:hypothetical protein [Dyadobacter soli]SDF55992.1 hypothetical protein SAMN04487996_111145 [Dyadobacter soli]
MKNILTIDPEIGGQPAKPEFIPDAPVRPQIPYEPEIVPEPEQHPLTQPEELPPRKEGGSTQASVSSLVPKTFNKVPPSAHRLSSHLVFLVLVMAMLSSCVKDHQIPTSQIQILTLSFSPATQSTVFRIQATQLGDQPIIEHGVVFTAYFRGVGNHNQLPTISDNKVVFDNKLILGTNEYAYMKDIIAGRTFFYYRAYAILSDNSVVYANRLSYTIE